MTYKVDEKKVHSMCLKIFAMERENLKTKFSTEAVMIEKLRKFVENEVNRDAD